MSPPRRPAAASPTPPALRQARAEAGVFLAAAAAAAALAALAVLLADLLLWLSA